MCLCLCVSVCAKLLQLCLTLCDPIDGSPPGSLSLGFSRQEYWNGLPFPSPTYACRLSHFSHIQLCTTLSTAALQAPLSTGFSKQEYWSGLPFPSPADDDCSHEIKRCLLLGRKAMTNLESVLKTRNITLPTKVYIVKL